MIVIFKDKIFEFSNKDINKLKDARDYGLSIGIFEEQMPFELLIKSPYAYVFELIPKSHYRMYRIRVGLNFL